MGSNNAAEYAEGARSLLRAGVQGQVPLYRSGEKLLTLRKSRLATDIAIMDTATGELSTFFRNPKGWDSVVDFLEKGRFDRFYAF